MRHARSVNGAVKRLKALDECELFTYAKEIGAPYDLVKKVVLN